MISAMTIFESLFHALNDAEVRYVVVGGLAVVMHGHARLTADVDLMVDLDPEQAERAIDVLVRLGLRPRLPVNPQDFADRVIRESWVLQRRMRVFSMFDPSNPMRVVDLFAEHPLPFAELWARSELFKIRETTVRVASIPDLVFMKRLAGRPQDLDDITRLETIQRKREGRDSG